MRHLLIVALLAAPLAALAGPANAVQVPFTGTLSLGNSPEYPWYGTLPRLNYSLRTQSGGGTAEVSYVGTEIESVQVPAGAFVMSGWVVRGDGFLTYETYSNAQNQGGTFSPSSLPAGGLLMGDYSASYYPDPLYPGQVPDYRRGTFSPPLAAIGTVSTHEFLISDPQDPDYLYFVWETRPWSVVTSGNEFRAESMGPITCFSSDQSECLSQGVAPSFGAVLTVDLALDPGQTGFGPGTGQASLLGGAGTTGGLDILLDVDAGEGVLTASFQAATLAEIEGLYGALPFALPNGSTSLWEIEGGDSFDGTAELTFGYDPALLPPGFDETLFAIAHFDGSVWELLSGSVDLDANTITVQADSFSPFLLVAVPEPGTGLLVMTGLLGLAARRTRRA